MRIALPIDHVARALRRARIVIVAAVALTGRAVELQPGYAAERLADGIDSATALVSVPDGRILVAEQTGALRVFKDGAFLAQPALELSARLDTYWERGFIGLALAPDFAATSELFVLYVAKAPFVHHVLSRFAMHGDVADPASERVLLEGDDEGKFGGKLPAGHQGGPICFGGDGKLYVCLGEQTNGALSQSLTALQGKILRLNRDGSIPGDNPFFTTTTGKYRSIWALGLRNPFGLAVQPESGRLFACDVGETSFEEIDEILPGENYGWPIAEGLSGDSRFRNPIHAYPPAVGRCIAGALFYPEATESKGAPELWRGQFLFADWAAGWIRMLNPKKPEEGTTFARGLENPVALARESTGDLLVLNRGTIWRDGKDFRPNAGSLIRIRPTGESTASPANSFPLTLAATGLFDAISPLQPSPGFAAFEINLPPWQPGIRARRWMWLPAGGKIGYSAQGEWDFPKGAIVVQHFETDGSSGKGVQPIETQVLWLSGGRKARAAAYHWAPDGQSMALVREASLTPLPGGANRQWISPAAEAELNLDTAVLGFGLPVNARQLNRQISDSDGQTVNQLAAWNGRGWFRAPLQEDELRQAPQLAPPEESSAAPEERVRSWLDVNCSGCHRPGGSGRGAFDARYATPLASQGIIEGALLSGDLGVPGAKVITPGAPEKSALYLRLNRSDQFRMPPMAPAGEPPPIAPVLAQWIAEMKPPQTPAGPNAIRVSNAVLFGEMECFRIETPSATYLFGKRGAGFASILDPAGHDWISYKPGGKSLGEYRGLPKCGHPVKYFHCGYGFGQYTNENWFTSVLAVQEPAHVRIHSETRNGDASGDWDIFADSATFTLSRSGGEGYWFIYEGTPDGELKPEEDYLLKPGGKRTALSEPWTGNTPWVAIGAKASAYALVMVNHQDDSPVDSYVSWPYKKEEGSGLNEMAIFGFGRPGWTDPKQHQPQLHRFPARFSIAIAPAAEAEKVARRLGSSKAETPLQR